MSEYATSPPSQNVSFRLQVWIGSVGGAALSADSAPNSTPPQASRLIYVSPKPGTIATTANTGTFKVVALGGTSIVIQLWFYDDTVATWLKLFGSTITVSTASGLSPLASTQNIGGAKIFPQITSNTGVTAIGYDLL